MSEGIARQLRVSARPLGLGLRLITLTCLLVAVSGCVSSRSGPEPRAKVIPDAMSANGAAPFTKFLASVGGPMYGPTAPHERRSIVAWQPSHQDDTGDRHWHEYRVCGEIVDEAIAALPEFRNVKVWETSMGLTGTNTYRPLPTNTRAFDAETGRARAADADVFIAVHVDGGAPSGVLGEYLPGDARGRALAKHMVNEVCKATGLPNRGVRADRLYSLEKRRNPSTVKCLLELGDNMADRAMLNRSGQRRRLGRALAAGVSSFGLP